MEFTLFIPHPLFSLFLCLSRSVSSSESDEWQTSQSHTLLSYPILYGNEIDMFSRHARNVNHPPRQVKN